MIALRSRRTGIVSTAVLVVLAVVLTWFATRADGESVRKADLNDGGVWVTNAAQARVGRVNKPAGQLDAAVAASTPENTGLDVLQDGAAVLALMHATNQAVPVNVRTAALVEAATLTLPGASPGSAGASGSGSGSGTAVPVAPPADLRGGTLAVVDPAAGKLRAQRVDTEHGITGLERVQSVATPLATVGGNAVVAVGADGSAYAVSGAGGQLAVVHPTAAGGFTEPAMSDLGFTSSAQIQLTVVGTRWVVFDPASGLLRVEGGSAPIDLREALAAAGGAAGGGGTGGGTGGGGTGGGAAYAVVQQPGPEAAGVVVATGTGAIVVPIDGSDPQPGAISLPAGTEGTLWLAAPLRLGRCVQATWASATVVYYGRNCGEARTEAVAIETPAATGTTTATTPRAARTDGVRLRTNRGLVVLNDLDSGDLWDVDSAHPVKIDDWASVIPPPKSGDQNVKPTPEDNADQQSHRPPEANPDDLSVRPGRTSTLHVLDNDTDSQGAILAIAPGDVGPPDVAGLLVSASVDGQTISVSVPDKPAATTAHFTYWVNNGTGGPDGRSQATVTLTIVDDTVNTAPHLRTGKAKIASTPVPVVRNGHVAVAVLADWRDDENDPVVVEALDPGTSVDAAGALAVRAANQTGAQDVRYKVDDGRGGTTEAKVAVTVLGDEDRAVAPVAQADVVRAVQGKPVQLQPLGNDIPGADPTDPTARMRLAASVRGPGQLELDTNLDTGVVTVTGSAPGSYLLTYAAQVGAAVGAGRFRVDVLAPPNADAPPVAAPDAATVRDQAPTVADVLGNDYSPRSDVLAIQSVATTETWLRAWVIQGRWLRVQATSPLPAASTERRGVLAYTISDGTKTATGELSVVQKPPPPATVLPTVVDDQAIVRWGDVVSIPVLDNDSMADGVPLKITPRSATVLTGGGEVYASGSVLRYLPGKSPITTQGVAVVEYAAYPEGMPDRAVTARATVTITPPPTPQTPDLPPTARDFSATVTAGSSITLTVPTSGVDPDGDLGFVSGVVGEAGGPVSLRLGRVVSFGQSAIRYEAYPGSSGTEVIRYVLTDRYGKSGEGLIRVGVVQPGAPQPPVAVADDVYAAPGRVLTIDPLANDLIPSGTEVALEDPAALNGAAAADFAKQPDNTFVVTAPEEGPAKTLMYGIDGGLFDVSRAAITVRGRKGFDNPPIAVDDIAKVGAAGSTAAAADPAATAGTAAGDPAAANQAGLPAGQTPGSVLVDVLANDRDIDGPPGDLKVVEVGDGASIVADGVRVTLADYPRAVPYVVEDRDGVRSMALIYVPAAGNDAPYAVSGRTVTMDKNGTVAIRLNDYVADPRGRVVKVTTADRMSTSPAGLLAGTVTAPTDLTLTASDDYVGPAALMLEVTDSTGADDTAARTAYVVIPVQVGPLAPLLRCSTWEVNVVADTAGRVIDIPQLCSAWFPDGLDPASVAYAADWDTRVDKVTLGQTDEGGRRVTLVAAADAVHGARGTILVGLAGSTERFPVRVRVTSLHVDPAAAVGPDAPPPPPPATLRPARVEGLIAGQSQVVNLAQYLDSPFGTLHCAIEATRATSTDGVTVNAKGCLLTVSAGPDAAGVSTFVVDVSDAPDRIATGSVTVSVLSKPGAPQGVSAVADRIQGGSARVSWLPPAYDGGLPVLEYQVSASGGPSLICSSSPCTVTGLTNGAEYRFVVTARNAAGWGPAGGPADPVVPDTAPEAVAVGPITAGDRQLTISWSPPVNNGSSIEGYNVQLVSLSGGSGGGTFPVGAGSLSTVVGGLVNDDQYDVRVQARNGAGWGPYGPSRTAESVGTPAPVATPVLSYPRPTPNDASAPVQISWPDTDPNGPPLVSFTVWRQVNGGSWSALTTVSAGAAHIATDTVTYDGSTIGYAVTATNGGGQESARTNVVTFEAVGVPETPRPPHVDTPAADKGMTLSFSLGGSHSRGWASVNYRTTAGVTGSFSCGGGGDCAKSVPLANGKIDVQTLSIQGCPVVGACSDWSDPSNQFQPYGPTLPVVAGAPDITRTGPGRYTVTFSWNIVENGRPVTVSADVVSPGGGTCRLNAAETTCSVTGVGYDTPVTVNVVASSVAGAATAVRMSARTPAKLAPTITLARSGQICVGVQCGTANADTCPPGTACEYITVSSTNWDAATMQCTFVVGTTTIGSTGTNVPTNTSKVTGVAYGAAAQIVGTCTDTESPTTNESATDSIQWQAVPQPPGPTTGPTTP